MAGEPDGLQIFREAYPDISFTSLYDRQKADWLIVVKVPEGVDSNKYKEYEFYWAGGRFLPESELYNANNYWSLLYLYPKELKDPKDFTDEEIKAMRNIGSKDSRNNTSGTPMFLFDALYSSFNEESVKEHLVGVMFLGKWMKIHERLVRPLSEVDKKIKALAKTDKEVAQFLKDIGTLDSYYWREIRDVNRKSFH
ncbi:MAG: M15 family peptidase, partial [Treponema sp.]|nr:M15 family peptidase [Treponema sp.]